MLHLRAHLRFHIKERLKMPKSVKKKLHFTLELMIHLSVKWRGATEDTFDGAPKDALSDLHKDVVF